MHIIFYETFRKKKSKQTIDYQITTLNFKIFKRKNHQELKPHSPSHKTKFLVLEGSINGGNMQSWDPQNEKEKTINNIT